jgi:T5SS/PEP-CTERM-associated repeat protein
VGVLKVLDGGALANLVRADIGEQRGSFGSVVISGAGSEWRTPMGVEIGSRGHGRLEVTDGGYFSNGARADIGNENGSTGEVQVIGKDSRWVTDWGIEIGPAGTGILLIADGGQVKNGVRFDVGAHETGNGQVFVCGAKSSWTCTGGGTVGQKGTGAITVQEGGNVTARSFDVGRRGSVGGEGTINGSIRNAGIVRSRGALVVKGDVKQEASGTLLIERLRPGDQMIEVRIEGTAFLNGTLDLTHFHQPSSRWAEIPIVKAEKIEGKFSKVHFAQAAEEQRWRIKYSRDAVYVEVPPYDAGGNEQRPIARLDQ